MYAAYACICFDLKKIEHNLNKAKKKKTITEPKLQSNRISTTFLYFR